MDRAIKIRMKATLLLKIIDSDDEQEHVFFIIFIFIYSFFIGKNTKRVIP